MLLISHDTLEVAGLADRIGVLHHGRMIAEGAPSVLLAEAFGHKEELVLRLAAPPSELAARELSEAGLAPAEGGLVWCGLVVDAAARARALHDRLAQAGTPYRELAVRPPGLDALTTHLTEAAG